MRNGTSLALILVTGTLLSIACGDDDDPNPAGGGGRDGTAGGSSTGGDGTLAGAGGTSADAGRESAGAPAAGSGVEGGSAGAAGASGGQAGAGGSGTTTSAGPFHLYVGCADSTGTLQSYLVSNGSISPLPTGGTVVTGGGLSNATFNEAENLLYVAWALPQDARLSVYTRNKTSGALSPVGTPALVPFLDPGAGGASGSGAGGTAGTGGVTIPALGAGPQVLTLDGAEKFLAVPNYFAHDVYVYDVLDNGSVGPLVDSDSGGNNGHDAVFSHNNDYLLVPYLGANTVRVYAFDGATGTITFESDTELPENSGPRHLALHANGSWLYSINETAGGAESASGSIDRFSFDETNGTLTHEQTYPVPLPEGYSGAKNGSEIVIAPSGDFLYVSMRLDNMAVGSLVAYSIGDNGDLTLVEQESSQGVTPRQFSLSPDGRLLAVGNQNSASLVLFSVDETTGELDFLTKRDVCASPRFARFATVEPAK